MKPFWGYIARCADGIYGGDANGGELFAIPGYITPSCKQQYLNLALQIKNAHGSLDCGNSPTMSNSTPTSNPKILPNGKSGFSSQVSGLWQTTITATVNGQI